MFLFRIHLEKFNLFLPLFQLSLLLFLELNLFSESSVQKYLLTILWNYENDFSDKQDEVKSKIYVQDVKREITEIVLEFWSGHIVRKQEVQVAASQ